MKPSAPRAPSRWFGRLCPLCAALGLAIAGRGQNENISRSSLDSMPAPVNIPRIRGMIYFPPVPPALDRPVSRANVAPAGRGHAPPELAPHVGEFFYPQLASRLAGETGLSKKHQQALADYTATKMALLRELRAELDKNRAQDAPTRLRALEALARRQAPQLAQLEKKSEQLRRDLLEADRDWSDFREWRLSETQRRGFSPSEVAQVMHAYAYFQNGLSPAQRRLLIEVAFDLISAVEKNAKATGAAGQQFFSPEPARIVFPDDAPPEVAARFAVYQSKKATLKKQLYDAVYAADGGFSFLHNPLRALAEKQAPAFDELEKIAEEVRRGLSVQATAATTDRSPLPPALVSRLMGLQQQRLANQREAATKAQALLARVRREPLRVNYRFDDDGLKFSVIPYQRGGVSLADKRTVEKITADFAALAEEYGKRLAALVNERDAIREEAGTVLGTKSLATIDNALNTAARLALAQESADAYAEYRTAVFEPGLSVEQRRLLLDGALQRLDLPLPRGELQPTRRAN